MRTIKYTAQFKRDYKREKKSNHKIFDRIFLNVVKLLAADKTMLQRHQDHALTGDWKDHRDCHIRPDLVLIYRKPSPKVLELVRLGSHSKLGL